MSLPANQLREELRERGLNTRGRKKELQDRLASASSRDDAAARSGQAGASTENNEEEGQRRGGTSTPDLGELRQQLARLEAGLRQRLEHRDTLAAVAGHSLSRQMIGNFWLRRCLLCCFFVAAFGLYVCWSIYGLVNSRLSINVDLRNPPPLPDGHVSLEVTDAERRQVLWCNKTVLTAPVTAQDLRFVRIHQNDKDLFTYSAYYDQRDKPGRPEVRAVGIALAGGGGTRGLLCQLWYRRMPDVMAAVPATVETVPEGNGRRYDSVLLSCENRAHDGEAPYAVSFVRSACAQPHGIHPVRPLPGEAVRNGRIAVCVSPLNLNYDKVVELVQTFELNRMFGADHFLVYNHTTSDRMTRLLANTQVNGDVTILPFHPPVKVHAWPIPPGHTEDVKYFAQMAMLQDCIMRASVNFEFAVFTDMDEVIVPRALEFATWRDVIRARMPNTSVSGLSFQNSFYRLEWPSDPATAGNATITGLGLSCLLKLRRETSVYPHGTRSKMIVRPHAVRVMGVHNVWRFFHGNPASVDFADAGMHHYRSWQGGGEQTFVQDPLMLRYREAIVARVTKARLGLGLPVKKET